MVILKSHKAMGSFLGQGTHVWLEVLCPEGNKVTFSGAKAGRLLGIVENLKRDYDKPATRGSINIPPPKGFSNKEWATEVITAGRAIKWSMHKKLRYSGAFPDLSGYGNCATIAKLIIKKAGGKIPQFNPSGFTPRLNATLQYPIKGYASEGYTNPSTTLAQNRAS